MHETVAKLESAVLDAIACGEPLHARALQFLLRRYQIGDRSDERAQDTLGGALAVALDAHRSDRAVLPRAAWVDLFVEASALSDDQRLVDAIETLTRELRPLWTASTLAERCAAIGACLQAAGLEAFGSMAADAVDELERTIGRAYEPGESIGSCDDQVRAASALLTGYRLTGRLPYSMLAEELMRTRAIDDASLDTTCEAARVLCRLAVLHDDPAYRAAAVLAPGADYRREAAALLDARADEALRLGAGGAIYALARLELESGRND